MKHMCTGNIELQMNSVSYVTCPDVGLTVQARPRLCVVSQDPHLTQTLAYI